MTTSELPFRCKEGTLRALAQTMVPEAADLSAAGWQDLYRIIGEALRPRPAVVKRQLSAFVRILELYSLLRYQRGIAGLTPAQREKLLHSIERSPVLLLRKGLWGLRTLVFMGFYARAEAAVALQYRADARGWSRPALSRTQS